MYTTAALAAIIALYIVWRVIDRITQQPGGGLSKTAEYVGVIVAALAAALVTYIFLAEHEAADDVKDGLQMLERMMDGL